MSPDPPTYLASLRSNIRQRPIPWDGAVRAGTITEQQLARIRSVDKAKKQDARQATVEADLDGYRLLFVGEPGEPSVLESAAKHAKVVQYILVLLGDLLDGASFTPCCPVTSHQSSLTLALIGTVYSGCCRYRAPLIPAEDAPLDLPPPPRDSGR